MLYYILYIGKEVSKNFYLKFKRKFRQNLKSSQPSAIMQEPKVRIKKELNTYTDYTKKVKYQLIPGV
jgi:hypothetical protein